MRLNELRLEQQLAALSEVRGSRGGCIQVMSSAAQTQSVFGDSGDAKLDEQ